MTDEGGKIRYLSEHDLSPRAHPVQKRSMHTVDRILDAAGVLLEDVGVDGFNTNLLAERAGVAVRSIYRYYPNKFAVIVGLAERHADEWQLSFGALLLSMRDPKQSALDAWVRVLDAYVAYLEEKPGRSAIRRAVRALPQLQVVDLNENDALSQQITSALEERGVDQPTSLLRVVARLLIETADGAIDDALCRRGRVPRAVVDQLKVMHRNYLALYV